MIIDIESYKESLFGGLNDPQDVEKEIQEIKNAKIGTLKADCWKKIDENTIEMFEL